MIASLSTLETELRQAAGHRAYADVERLVVLLCAATTAQLHILPKDDPRIHEIAAWLHELLDWTGTMLRISRATQADELRRIPFVRSYLSQQIL